MTQSESNRRAVWLIRAGLGSRDADAFEQTGTVGLALPWVPGLSSLGRSEAIGAVAAELRRSRDIHPTAPPRNLPRDLGYAAMLLRFIHEVRSADFVITPREGAGEFLCGSIQGQYQATDHPPVAGYFHLRRVTWLGAVRKTDIPNGALATLRAPLAIYLPGAQTLLQDLPIWEAGRDSVTKT